MNMEDAKNMIEDLPLPYFEIRACENIYMLFHCRCNHLMQCGVCGLDRHDHIGLKRRGNPKLRPKKVLCYLPIIDCLKWLYE